jgi:hypothetical protein
LEAINDCGGHGWERKGNMIGHEMHLAKMPWSKVLLWDFLVPFLLIALSAWYLDGRYSKSLLQYLVDLPYLGKLLYGSPVFGWYAKWHFLLFSIPIALFSFSISFRTARIPGPGRAFFRWWQGLLQLRIKKEKFIDSFPPAFDRNSVEAAELIRTVCKNAPLARVLGYYKRFASDIELDRRMGKDPESSSDYFPIIISEAIRYRHIQVVGGTGSGKSASIIAPMLRDDAATTRLATLTVNPKADLYLLKVMADGVMKRKRINPSDRMPTAVISFSRKDSLAYDPLLYGDADTLTKKIMGSSEITHPFYKSFQETWLMSFFRVIKTEPLLVDRVMLRHLYQFLTKPREVEDALMSMCSSEHNIRRLRVLSTAKPESLAGVASHISQLVEDESLAHIFDNPTGPQLNIRDVIRKGGNVFLDLDLSTKGPQGRALGRMIMMEVQLLAGSRQAGFESKETGLQVYLDEFASFAYNGFIDLIDKCRSARVGLLLAHQSLGNLQRDNLSKSFKDEVVDNTFSKFFLTLKDETAEWASRQMGTRKILKKTLTIGHATEQTDTRGRQSHTLAFREDFEPYVQPSDLHVDMGFGYANIEGNDGKLVRSPIRIGYVDEKDLCSDQELFAFMKATLQGHPRRPRGGSLIDNGVPAGMPEEPILPPQPISGSDFHSYTPDGIGPDKFADEQSMDEPDGPVSAGDMDDLMNDSKDMEGNADA